ncbi:MAG: DUF378 domain-containing protein [Candidatus Kaelpia imicola]|nr:DUF378 domain-containing protein [Candidatus Kaelpia imicola]
MKKLAQFLVVVGGLNWGLVGFFNLDLVARIFGGFSTVSRVIYALIGLSALHLVIISLKRKVN